MGTMNIPSKTLHPIEKGCTAWQMGIFGFSQKETGAKSVAMATAQSYVMYWMYISGAEFQEHCFNISGDILVITFLICIIPERKYL